ncbi:protein SLC31A2-like isoform X2 [Bacillus rossius redtenbacheri]
MESVMATMDPCMIMGGNTMGPCNKTTTAPAMPGMGTTASAMPGMNMATMADYFHWGYNETILFQFWKIDSLIGLILSMVIIFAAGFLYEGLKTFRDIVVHKSFISRKKKNGNRVRLSLFFEWRYVLLSVLHGVLLSLGYSFMLIYMTFNAWLGGALVVGMSVGYFFFGWLCPGMEEGC